MNYYFTLTYNENNRNLEISFYRIADITNLF